MNFRISIITPSLNQGEYIERTIQSVISQDVESLEYLVIDGGSTDQTVDILKRYDKQIYWISEKDEGHSDAINKGIIRTSAPIVGWLNADDIYYPGALQTVLDYFDAHPNAEVVYGDANHIDKKDDFIDTYPTEEWNWDRLLETCFISQPATFLRRELFEKYGLLNINRRYSMDYDYWIRLGKKGVAFAYIPKLLAATRLHEQASTIAARIACHADVNDLMVDQFGKVPDLWVFHYAHAVAETKGFRRTDRLRFAIVLSIVSFYASLHWNRRISWDVVCTTMRWLGGNIHALFREKFAR